MKKSKTYRDFVIETIKTLVECDKMIFTGALNLLMSNELKEVDEVFEEGDIYGFSIEHLENSADTNVQVVLKTLKEIRTAIQSIQNINRISGEEIEWE